MKTLTTAALLAALACTGLARSGEPVKNPEPAPVKKAEPGKMTAESLRSMLEAMGYETKPATDKDGKVVGYDITTQYSGLTVYCRLELSQNGQVVWLYGTIAGTADANTPASVLLAMLAANNPISPASINYIPGQKKFEVLLTLGTDGITPAKLRLAIDQFARGVKVALDTYGKATAVEKEKQEQGEKPAK